MGKLIKRAHLEEAGLRPRPVGPGPGEGLRQEVAPPTAPAAEGPQPLAELVHDPAESEQVDRVRRLVQAMLRGFAQQRRDLLAELRPYVVRLAVEIARRMVQRELRTDPGLIVRTAESALEQVAAASQLRVRVHPLDAQILRETMDGILSGPDRAPAVEIVPDGSIEQGGCLVESDRGIVDARLRTQFEEMQTRLLDALAAQPSQEGAEA
jgi:flagellar biosynthesis/type III secretory pathway protein FliH